MPGQQNFIPRPGDAVVSVLGATSNPKSRVQANGILGDSSTAQFRFRSMRGSSTPPSFYFSSTSGKDAHFDFAVKGLRRPGKPSSLNGIDIDREPALANVLLPVQKGRAIGATEPAASSRFDHHQTLDPRGTARKRSLNELEKGKEPQSVGGNIVRVTGSPQRRAMAPATPGGRQVNGSEEGHGTSYGALIENLHGVQDRGAHPRKRLKQDRVGSEGGSNDSEAVGRGSSGVLGGDVKEKKLEGQGEGVGGTPVVDLTVDDDEPVVTYDSGAVEVCYGGITKARVQAHMVPFPRHGSTSLDPTMWPIIKVRLERRSGSNTNIICVYDALNNDFGSIDSLTAIALAPLMEARVVRIQARILMRKKKPGEQPGQAVSEYYDLSVNLYGKRRNSGSIGNFLGQKNTWLQAPLGVDSGIPTEVVHQPRPQAVAKLGLTQGYITRTVEEIRSDVVGVFDSLHKSDKLPEMQGDPRILTPLLSHQKQGLYFMTMKEKERIYGGNDMDRNSLWKLRIRGGQRSYYNVITSGEVSMKPPEVLGGILADMMGLGKTLSILSLVMSTLNDSNEWAKKKPPTRQTTEDPHLARNSKSTLLVAPLSTISNWEEQIGTHIKPGALSYYIYHGGNRLSDLNELAKFDMVITTYSVVASEQRSKVLRNGTPSPLERINWFRIVLDEAHMIREQSTKQSQAICRLSAQRRWAVTGTPVQNRLDDLGALIKFLRIKPFDDKKGFTEFILSPFKNANPEILPKLRLLVDSITLRRLKDRINLPPRRDEIIRLEFSDEERSLYEWFAKDSTNKMRVITTQQKNGLGGRTYAHVLRAILRLRLICAHGRDLLSEEDLKATEGWSRQNAIDLSDDDADDGGEKSGLTPAQAFEMYGLIKQTNGDTCPSCGRRPAPDDPVLDEAAASKDETIGFMTHCYQIVCKDCVHDFRKKVLENMSPDKHVSCPLCGQWIKPSLFELKQALIDEMEEKKLAASSNPRIAKQLGTYGGPHSKTRALVVGLLQSQALSEQRPSEPPIKSVVFSGWTSHLDLIQIALEDNKISYTRLDGKMSRLQRTAALESFRDDPSISVILVSLMAGGLGLNLTAASHAYVMEPQFNPAAEAQAVDRVHRLGQKRPVTTTRFIMSGSFEEKMLELQRKKQNLADLSMNKEKLDKGEAVKRRLEELRSLFK
ncbi:MAG: hypothetical protein M1839_003103 [Geoglossum umbratile]|nr:MAG: hypothetical protein M1839_003103 [Geoglossum umbratile]